MDIISARTRFADVIDISRYEIEEFLGKGGNGEVYGIRDINTNKLYAMKVIPKKYKKQKSLTSEQIKILKGEAEIQKKFKHSNIVQVEFSFDTDKYVVIIMDKCGEDLSKIGGQGKIIPEEKALAIFKQIVEAMAYIHKEGYAYRDIKTENVINCGNDIWKLIDFGFVVPEDTSIDFSCCTLEYTAPEALLIEDDDEAYFGQPTDIWALGVLLYEILTGTSPFDRKYERQIYKAIENEEPDYSKIKNPKIVKLLKRMLDKDPERRAIISEVKYSL